MATERPGPKMTSIIQIELRNNRRDPHGERLTGIRGLSILEKRKTMTPEEKRRDENEYWARVWENFLGSPKRP